LPSEHGYPDAPVRSFRWRLIKEACVLRLHLNAEDLMRTRFGSAPAPLAELTLALATLQRRNGLFDRWRRAVGKQLPVAARPLFELVPATAVSPLFLDPVSDGLDDGLDGSVLVYYPSLTPLPLVNGQPGADPLVDLLGRTRAAILTRAAAEQTTGRLARDLGISAAAVSEHVRILRRAGMLASQRHGKKILHNATPLGERLLRESAPSPAPD
jgi:DNA-binding transcriptional ArsR family regulator